MKKLLLALCALPMAASAVTTYEQANVESAVPQYREVRTQGQCRNIQVEGPPPVEARDGMGGSIVGGVVGGVLGNQVGGGHGRTLATVAGAIAGTIVGGNMERGNSEREMVGRMETRRYCEENIAQVVTGYLVTYEYKGQRGTVMMQRDPGRYLDMRVTAEPISR
jgi:uncharacterized protein YcfJ